MCGLVWIMLVMKISLHSFNSKETIQVALISSHRRCSCLCVSFEKNELWCLSQYNANSRLCGKSSDVFKVADKSCL